MLLGFCQDDNAQKVVCWAKKNVWDCIYADGVTVVAKSICDRLRKSVMSGEAVAYDIVVVLRIA